MQRTTFNSPMRVRRLSDEFNKMLSQWPGYGDEEATIATSDWSPAVDIKEEDARFLIIADVPGVDPNDVEVTMHNGMLSIRGERSDEKKEEKDGFRRIERSSGSFYRRFMGPGSEDRPREALKEFWAGVPETDPRKNAVREAVMEQ